MSEVPQKAEIHGLYVGVLHKNPWMISIKFYGDCMERFLRAFPDKESALKELNGPNINNYCKKELSDLREIAQNIRYKDIWATQKYLGQNTFFEETQVVKKR